MTVTLFRNDHVTSLLSFNGNEQLLENNSDRVKKTMFTHSAVGTGAPANIYNNETVHANNR